MSRRILPVLALGVLAGATAAEAKHSFKLEVKTFLQQTTYSDTPELEDGAGWDSDSSELKFVVDRLKLRFTGDINKRLSYGLRFRFDKDPSEKDIGQQSDMVDWAYIDHSINEMFSLTFGKYDSTAGGYEEQLSSMTTFIGTQGLDVVPDSITGVSANIKPIKDNTIMIQLGNNPAIESEEAFTTADDAAGTQKKRQQTPYMGLVYAGSFAGGIVQPHFSYQIEEKRELKVKGGDTSFKAAQNTYLSIGVGTQTAGLDLGVDYKSHTFGSQAKENPKDDAHTSIGFYASYALGLASPFIHYTSDSSEKYTKGVDVEADKVETDTTQLALGAILSDKSWGGLTYQFAYTSKTEETTTAGTKADKKPKTDTIWIGAGLKTGATFGGGKS